MGIHVFGAATGIGRWLITRCTDNSEKIYAYDINPKVVNEYQDKNVKACHLNKEDCINGDYLRHSIGFVNANDWVFVAIPEKYLEEFCLLLAKHLPDNCIVAVMTSRQAEPVKLVSQIVKQASVCGLHPLFGPTVASPHGQIIALCYNGNPNPKFDNLRSFFDKFGITVSILLPEEHDLYMGYVQALTHFVFLSFFSTVTCSGYNWNELMKVKTPPFQFLAAFSSRLLMGTPATYASIQNSDSARDIRENFLKLANELHIKLSRESQKEREDVIGEIRNPFSGTLLDELSQFSITAVAAVQDRERYFFDVMQKKEVIVFKTKNTNRYRVGFVEKIGPTYIEFNEILTRIKNSSGNKRVPIPINSIAIESYRQDGIKINMRRNTQVKKGNIVLLPKEECMRWIEDNILSVSRLISVHNPMDLAEEIFEKWVPTFVPGVKKCFFVEAHKKRGEVSRVKLAISIDPSTSISEIEKNIRAFCYGYTPEGV